MKNLTDFLNPRRERHPDEPPEAQEALEACVSCGAALAGSSTYEQFGVCHACRFHYTIGAQERVALLVDAGSFRETHRSLASIDPLSFEGQVSYKRRVFDEQRRTGLTDAIVTGTATVRGQPLMLAVIDFRFFGGSFGCVVGEKLTLALESAVRKKLPVVVVLASGGIRIQEGLLSLAQVVKIAAAIERLGAAHLPLISLLGNPTIGAGYVAVAGLSDLVVAEPGAVVGYATTRAVEETFGGHLPHGAHSAESHLNHGLIDQIVDRTNQRDFLSALLDVLAANYRLMPTGAQPRPSGVATPAPPWNTVQLARHEHRPTALDYIGRMTSTFIELHGDRIEGDDPAVVCGVGQIGGETVMFIGQERRHGQEHGPGIGPEGFRKTQRAMALAGKLRLPVVGLIDTCGAATNLQAEEHGLGTAMAACLATASSLPVPVVSVIVGEGGSEAALTLAAADRLLMLEHAVFMPVSPELAASILYRDRGRAGDAASALRLTAGDCARLGIVDGVVPEPVGGAHTHHEEAAREVKAALLRSLTEVQSQKPAALVRERYRRLRGKGRYSNYIGTKLAREVSELGEAVGRRAAALVSRIRHQSEAGPPGHDDSLLVP